MPKIFEWNGCKFFFFSNEGFPPEPCHIHVTKGKSIAKFWISENVELDSSWEFSSKELNNLEDKIEEQKELIKEKWNEYFSR